MHTLSVCVLTTGYSSSFIGREGEAVYQVIYSNTMSGQTGDVNFFQTHTVTRIVDQLQAS